MKKVIIFLLLLIVINSNAQVTTRVIGDSIKMYQTGSPGTAELILENGTKSVQLGFLQNKGNGRTKFTLAIDSVWQSSGSIFFKRGSSTLSFSILSPADTINKWVNNISKNSTGDSIIFYISSSRYAIKDSTGTGGSSNDSTLQLITNKGPITTNDVTLGYKPEIGIRYQSDFGTTSWTDVTPNVSVTQDATGITLGTGGGWNLNNYVESPVSQGYFSSHNYTMSGSFIPLVKDNNSLALCIAQIAQGNGQSLFNFFHASDTAGYITTSFTASTPTTSDVNTKTNYSLKWSSLDTFKYEIKRESYKLWFTLTDVNTGSSLTTYSPTAYTSDCLLRFYILGSSSNFKILNDLKIVYNDPKNAKILLLGNSIATGMTGFSEASRWENIAFDGVQGGMLDFSGAAEQTIDGWRRVPEIINYYQPQIVIWPYGVNDHNTPINIDSFTNRTRRSVQALKAAGITVVMVNLVPQGSGPVGQYNDSMQSIANSEGLLLIDIYSELVGSGTSVDAKYNYGDNVHLNEYGNHKYGDKVRNSMFNAGLISFSSPVTIPSLPTSTAINYDINADAYGRLSKSITGTNPSYLWVHPETNIGTKYQIANFNLHGTAWFSNVVIGGSPQTFTTGYTLQSESIYGNQFRIGTGSNRVDIDAASLTVAQKPIELFNGTQVNVNSQSMVFNQLSPQTTKHGLIFKTSSSGGGTVESTYKFLSLLNVSDTVLMIGRAGNISADSVHKYNSDMQSLILADDRNLPDVGAVKKIVHDSSGTGGASAFIDLTDVPSSYTSHESNIVMVKADGTGLEFKDTSGLFNGGVGAVNSVTAGLGTAVSPTTGNVVVNLDTSVGTGAIMWPRLQKIADSLSSLVSGGGANTALSNLASVAINTDLIPGTDDGAALGSTTKKWSDLNLANGAVVNFNNGNFTWTHSSGQVLASGNVYSNGSFRLNGSGSSYIGNNRSNPTAIAFQVYSSAGEMAFDVNSSRRMTILSGGNIGIGTSTPREILDVNGQISVNTVNAASSPSRDSSLVKEDGRIKYVRGDQTLSVNATDVGNVGSGEDDLMTYTIPASQLSTDNDRIEFEGVYNFTGSNNKTLKLYFGSQLMTSIGPGTSTAFIRITGTIIRTGATTQKASITMTSSSATYSYNVDLSTPAETLSGTVVIKSTGEATSDNDIVQKSFIVKFFPAP